MRTFKFYKESDSRWYVDLPEWEGPKAALEMVMGADTMLDILSQGTGEVVMYMSTEFQERCERLVFLHETPDIGEGAYYHMESYMGLEFNLDVWLCDVTKFVFGDFPKEIYFSKIEA
jgi:hypothetical protein